MADYTPDPDAHEFPESLPFLVTRSGKGSPFTFHPLLDAPGDVPTTKASAPPCTATCPSCGAHLLHALTSDDTPVALDLGRRTWAVVDRRGASQPRVAQSRAYVEHQCARGA